MNVLTVLGLPFPPDIRVEEEARSLSRHGYRVFVLAERDERPVYEEIEGIRVLRLIRPGRYLVFLDPIRVLGFVIQICRLVTAHSVRVIHVHDLPYAVPVVFVKKLVRRRVIFDMREHYVGMIEPRYSKKGLVGHFLTSLLRVLERVACNLSDRILVVADENAERLVRLGVPSSKITVVSNVADVDQLKNAKPVKGERDKFSISYTGGFDPHRGLDILIRAFKIVLEKTRDAHLYLVGEGGIRQSLEDMVDRLGIRSHVTFTGWLPLQEAMGYEQTSDLGVIPYPSTALTNHTLPHKLFYYMYFGRPVLVSDVKPLKRIVEEARCGLVFHAGNYNQLAEKILTAIGDPGLLRELGENGRKAVLEKYNWDREGAKLVRIYDEMLKSGQ